MAPNQTNKIISKRAVALMSATSLGLIFLFLIKPAFQSEQNHQSSTVTMAFQQIPIEKSFVEQTEKSLLIAPNHSQAALAAMNGFKSFLEHDPNARLRFFQTLKFFEGSPGAYPAARFMAMSGQYVTSPNVNYLMKWTQDDLKANSPSLMQILNDKKDEIYGDPFIHESFLNLAYQLDVPAEDKLNFYADTLRQEVKVQENGSLVDSSVGFETALILSKQVSSDGRLLAGALASLVAASDEKTKNAIEVRVMAYYPGLAYLFN